MMLWSGVRDHHPSIGFVISGASRDCNGLLGNFVVVSTLYTNSFGERVAATHSRCKHHRWQLDGQQIESYGLQDELSTRWVCWEYLEIGHRIIHMDVFRNRSALTAVICEDLARVDPALSLIRSLGPNLVFALLMDGPQLAFRWPGSYAASLTDGPGSSVLTITCAALIDRSNASRKAAGLRRGPRSIALWRHHLRMGSAAPPSQGTHQLTLLPNQQAPGAPARQQARSGNDDRRLSQFRHHGLVLPERGSYRDSSERNKAGRLELDRRRREVSG